MGKQKVKKTNTLTLGLLYSIYIKYVEAFIIFFYFLFKRKSVLKVNI